MFRKSILITCCLLLLPLVALAQQPAVKGSYETLLEKVKKQDPALNFTELRMAYTETKEYSPYGSDRESRSAMFAALNGKEFAKARELAEKILAGNYLDLNAHFVAYAANNQLGQTEKANYHLYVFKGLMKSITDSGDGKTMDTAFVVISTDEEYVFFNYMGLRPAGQALLNDKGHAYDKMTALDPKTEQSSTYYFNIDKPFNWLGNSLKSKQ